MSRLTAMHIQSGFMSIHLDRWIGCALSPLSGGAVHSPNILHKHGYCAKAKVTTYLVLHLDFWSYSDFRGMPAFNVCIKCEKAILCDCIIFCSIVCSELLLQFSSKSTVSKIKLVFEKENVTDMPNPSTAVNCCMTAYYIFNITYLNGISCLMSLLETFLCKINVQRNFQYRL